MLKCFEVLLSFVCKHRFLSSFGGASYNGVLLQLGKGVIMSFFEGTGWVLSENKKIAYQSSSLSIYTHSVLSAHKTYSDGNDIIRSVFSNKDGFSIVSAVVSCSGELTEALEEIHLTLELAKEALFKLCKEDDDFYK